MLCDLERISMLRSDRERNGRRAVCSSTICANLVKLRQKQKWAEEREKQKAKGAKEKEMQEDEIRANSTGIEIKRRNCWNKRWCESQIPQKHSNSTSNTKLTNICLNHIIFINTVNPFSSCFNSNENYLNNHQVFNFLLISAGSRAYVDMEFSAVS